VLTLGLDVGGTKVAGGLVAPDGTVVSRRTAATEAGGRRDPGLEVTRRIAAELAAEAGEHGLPLAGLGAGFAEYVTPDGELTSKLVLDWTEQPATLLAGLAGPVTIESDVRCGALGEARYGAGRGLDSFAYVSAGTGISYCLVIGGEPVPGARGEAIALGELPVTEAPGVTLERYASGDGIRARYADLTGQRCAGAREVLAAADRGDPAAADVVTSAARALAAALGWLVCLLDPAALVLGGGLSQAAGLWAETLTIHTERAVVSRSGPPPLLRAGLGADAGLIGAAVAARALVRLESELRPVQVGSSAAARLSNSHRLKSAVLQLR
jgi:glucokinase